MQPADRGRCTPSMAFPPRPGGRAPLGGGRKPGVGRDAHFCGNPEVSLLGLEGRPGVGVEVGESPVDPWGERRGAVVTAWSASLLLLTASLDGRGNPEMNVKFLFSRSYRRLKRSSGTPGYLLHLETRPLKH